MGSIRALSIFDRTVLAELAPRISPTMDRATGCSVSNSQTTTKTKSFRLEKLRRGKSASIDPPGTGSGETPARRLTRHMSTAPSARRRNQDRCIGHARRCGCGRSARQRQIAPAPPANRAPSGSHVRAADSPWPRRLPLNSLKEGATDPGGARAWRRRHKTDQQRQDSPI